MTGRELIIYILQNGLEEEEVFKDGELLGFVDEARLAAKFGVGVETIKIWHQFGWLNGYRVGEVLYFPITVIDPRIVQKGGKHESK